MKPEKMIKLARLAQASGLQLEINGMVGRPEMIEDDLIELRSEHGKLSWFEPRDIRQIALVLD